MPNEVFKEIDDGMGGDVPNDRVYRRFHICHRIFYTFAKNEDKDAFCNFFEKEWNKDPAFILTLMDIISCGFECEKFMEIIEGRKDNNEINDYEYLVVCNTIKTIHDYQCVKDGTLLPNYFLHRLTA